MTINAIQKPAPLQSGGIRLFCFPYGGGSAAVYSDWQHRLPAWLQVCPVELPGRGWRLAEPLPVSLLDLATDLAAELRPHATVPCAIFGHSMGALLAYEVAKRLATDPECPIRKLVVSASPAPSRRKPAIPPVSEYSDADLVQLLIHMGGTSPKILADAELTSLLLPRLRADYAICETYRDEGGKSLRVPVAGLCGDRDTEAGEGDMLFWRELTRGDFTAHIFAGGHFFIIERKSQVLDTLADELDRVRLQKRIPSTDAGP
jgi:surfactin synthase thioesterase subunit